MAEKVLMDGKDANLSRLAALVLVIGWLPLPEESAAEGEVWLRSLFAEFAQNLVAAGIGLAGEYKYGNSGIIFDDLSQRATRYAGRGGLGSVMGSKGLKALLVKDKARPRPTGTAFRTAVDAAKVRGAEGEPVGITPAPQ